MLTLNVRFSCTIIYGDSISVSDIHPSQICNFSPKHFCTQEVQEDVLHKEAQSRQRLQDARGAASGGDAALSRVGDPRSTQRPLR